MEIAEVNFIDIEINDEYIEIAEEVLNKCFKEESLGNKNIYVNVIFTNPKNIKEINNKYRNINEETDVLSFPMFEAEDIKKFEGDYINVLGDIVISIEKVKEQSLEYGHSFKRELSYMITHAFYHLIGYDHIDEEDKNKMREKEEKILKEISLSR